MEKQEQAQIIIDNLWAMLGDQRLKGCSAYEAARKIGANDELAQLVSRLWNGPDPLT